MSLYHLHTRKRTYGKTLHSYPASTRPLRIIDRLVYAAGIISPAMMLPQLYLIYSEKNAGGLSPISWFAFALFNIPWIMYGIAHKEKPLIMTYVLWFIANGLVFVGALLY